MKNITVLAVKSVTRSAFIDQLEEMLIERFGAGEIDMRRYLCSNDYWDKWRQASNLITWGIKWKSDRYRKKTRAYPKQKNTLYVENGLMKQGVGFYVDHRGYFCDSSMVLEETNKSPYTAAELSWLESFVKRSWKWDYGKTTADPDGPILVALQTNNDAPMRHHFPAARGTKGRECRKLKMLELCREYLPYDREVIIRPHPKERSLPKDFEMPDNWRVENDGPIYPLLPSISGLVAVNSTVATEAMGINIPIATLGNGSFDNTGATLDCSKDPSLIAGVLTAEIDREARTRYLCEIFRNHQAPRKKTNVADFLNRSTSIESWIENLHDTEEKPSYRNETEDKKEEVEIVPKRPNAKRRRKAVKLKTCVYCAKDTRDTGCARCKCQHCKQRNC